MESPKPATERRAPLNKERVLHAAAALAAREGIESLTMRKLADELGAGAMSLYHYVPNKEELLDGMVDIVFSESNSRRPTSTGRPRCAGARSRPVKCSTATGGPSATWSRA